MRTFRKALPFSFGKEIISRYGAFYKGQGLDAAQRIDIMNDEVSAHYAEEILSNKHTLERLVAAEPTLKDKILSFFKGASSDYESDAKLSRAARRYYKTYKKLFDEFSERNFQNNAAEASIKKAVTRTNDENVQVTDDIDAEAPATTNTDVDTDTRFALIGRTEDGRGIYRTNYPENTPKDVKQKDIVDLVQNVWSKKPIKLNLIVDGKEVPIEARFNPELTERSDLSKIAFGNRKGTASEKRITMNLSSDLYQIAEESHHVGSKTESGKDNAAHAGVTTWHYFLTDLVYVEADGTEIECYMNIDVKQNDSGHWFYSFAIEKGSRPADVLSVVTDKSATTSTISITENAEKINPSDENSSKNPPKKRFALPETDSEGTELTSDQRKYFDASKQLDSEGRLQVMYQGAPEEFFTFDKKKSKASNLYGRGFYFTNSADQARHYGNVRSYYLNITNPLSAAKKTISRMQMRKFLNAVAENEDYSIENYGTYDVAEVLRSVYSEDKSDFAMLYDVSLTAIGDLVEAVELFNQVNGTEYDGFILDTESVIFRSEQAKLTSNAAPSSTPDTRYALTIDENLDALFDDDADGSNSAQDATFDVEAVVARGMPRTAGKSSLTVGELRKIIANNTKQKVYSKQDALSVVGRFAGISDLTQKTRTEIADAVWQILNESPDVEYRRDVAHDMAEFIVAKIIMDAKKENGACLIKRHAL